MPRRIGVLFGSPSPEGKEAQKFRQGLLDAGYTEGRDVLIEWRSARGDPARLPELASELIQRNVEVIVVTTTDAARAVKRGTSTIPIIMAVGDPVGAGLVTNLARPGGNMTGLSSMSVELGAKRLQLLKEAIPNLARATVLWNPATPIHAPIIEELKLVAPSLAIELTFVAVSAREEIRPAFSAMGRAHAQALYLLENALFYINRTTLANLALEAKLPTMFGERRYAEEGGLISYGPDYGDLLRRSAGYVDKVLKGAAPGSLPIEQPTRFELVINLKTAKTIGLRFPDSILLRADEVIQ